MRRTQTAQRPSVAHLEARPWWMTALALFCLATVAFLVSRDVLIERVRDVEVWFGFEVRGIAAKLTAPIHWAIFLAGAWGFWRARPWILPAAAAYAFYVALSHVVFSAISPNGDGWLVGLVLGAVLSAPGWLLLFASSRRRATRA